MPIGHYQDDLLRELGEEYLKEKGRIWLNVISGSMAPFFKTGDKILGEYVKYENIHMGDTVIFKGNDGLLVTHRILWSRKINNELYLLEKGDNNKTASWIPSNSVVAKVIGIKRGNRTLRLKNGKSALIINMLFGFYQLNCYVDRKIFRIIKNHVRNYRGTTIIRLPCRCIFNGINKGLILGRNYANYLYVKAMALNK